MTDNLEGVARANDELLANLVVTGGSGTDVDRAAALGAARLLPASVAGFLLRKDSQIIICRESITDVATELKGERPRGWPDGMTWDTVPGCFDTKRFKVLVATRANAAGARVIPQTGDGHGSVDLLLHETMHGHDFLKGHRILKSEEFETAYLADFEALGSYERQEGDAGRQEAYAESAARVFGGDSQVAAAWPRLTAFWQAIDASELELGPAVELPPIELDLRHDRPIGTAEFSSDGKLHLDLRAENDSGMIGHASFAFAPGTEDYARALDRLRPGDPDSEASVEAVVGQILLVAPFD